MPAEAKPKYLPDAEDATIARFRLAIMDIVATNEKINGHAPVHYPPTAADQKRIGRLMEVKRLIPHSELRKAFRDGDDETLRASWRYKNDAMNKRDAALKELNDAAPDVLKLFRKYHCDSSAVFAFLRDAGLLRKRDGWASSDVDAAVDNLRLHASEGPVQLPNQLPPGAILSRPMSKSEMGVRAGLSGSRRKTDSFLKFHGLHRVGDNRQLFQVEMQKMDAHTRTAFEKP